VHDHLCDVLITLVRQPGADRYARTARGCHHLLDHKEVSVALPENITPVVVTGNYIGDDGAGTPATGTVTFTPSKATWRDDATGLAIILPTPVIGTLDVDGQLLDPDATTGVKLVPTDATGVLPTGGSYDVVEDLVVTKGGKTYPFTRSYSIFAPHGASFDLSAVAPVDPSGGGAQRTVLSVNTKTPDNAGAVTLVAADVGAISQATADTRYDAHGAAATEQARAQAAEAGLLPKTDPAVTNSRTPLAHATSHATAGSDPVTPASIGAVAVQAPQTLTDAATILTDASTGTHFRVTLGGNRTLDNPTGLVDGQKILWELIQDGTGGRTITLGSRFEVGADLGSITLSTAPGARDFLGAVYNTAANLLYVIAFARGY
jgi:hypothetical protein